ncbi:MAG: PSD1 and planctomycete cytochrome C domain-containing protein [Planctomycetaceae bacterium]
MNLLSDRNFREILALCSGRASHSIQYLLTILMGLLVTVSSAILKAAEQTADSSPVTFTDQQLEFFEKEVRPILSTHCYECHGPDTHEANLRLDAREFVLKGGDTGPSIEPGHPESSELIEAINYEADSYQMPPDGKLSSDQIAILSRWVQEGAPWPDEVLKDGDHTEEFNLAERAKHWSFQPVQDVPIPEFQHQQWPLQPIENFIVQKLEDAKLQPGPASSREVWLRRVTFDLTGLPPTPEEREAFLNDESDQAYEVVVDRLLASKQYGVRWARHWLDLMRFAETYGHEFDFNIEHAWRYRDYVVRAFNQDLPYDQFIKEHLAGDLMESPRRTSDGYNESIVGTGFYWLSQGKHSPVSIRAEECDLVDNQIDVLSKSFLGLTVSCARCHDHKFDPITTADYYAFAGYLQSSRFDWPIINDTPQVQASLERIEKLATEGHEKISIPLLQSLNEQLQADVVIAQLKEKLFEEKLITNEPHPFHLWFKLSQLPDINDRNNLMKETSEKISKESDFIKRSVLFEDFQSASSPFWFFSGWGMRKEFAKPFELVPASLVADHWEFTTGAQHHMSQFGRKLEGTLRSDTFKVEKRYIHYLVSRRHGKLEQPRGYKQGSINLIVDGFQIIRNPLYGNLSIQVPLDPQNNWITQDVTKGVGRKAYIEILDEDDGDLILNEIRFSDDPNPPLTTINKSIYQTLENSDLSKLDETCYQLIRSITSRAVSHRETLNADDIHLLNTVVRAARPLAPRPLKKRKSNFREGLTKLLKTIPEAKKAVAIARGTPERETILIRGNPEKQGDFVPRRFLEVFEEENSTIEETNRLALAEKIASAENPLTARVIVNRLWQHHFGRGIVASSDNFGVLGQRPSHPELLEFLARELIRQHWSLKALHRQMVLSQTYRMASEQSDSLAEEQDPANLLWHRMPIRRLEAEAIRDSILLISGELSPDLEGHSVLPYLSEFMEGRGRPTRSGPLDGDRRRGLYLNVRRNFLNPMFLAFDYPTPHSTIGRRSISNVPSQALAMMNNPFVVDQASKWVTHLNEEQSTSQLIPQQITRMYLQAYGREPTVDEIASGMNFLDQQQQEYVGDPSAIEKSWADYAHVLFNVKEFIYLK